MNIEDWKKVLQWINTEIIIVILIPGAFLSFLLFGLIYSKLSESLKVIPNINIILFLISALVLGWTTHFFALWFYSKLIWIINKLKTKKFPKGKYSENMRIYRNFFANLSLILPWFIGFFFENMIYGIFTFLLYFTITLYIYIQCENAKTD